jgi:uncharacterized protein (TIGR02271 family)
MVLYKLDDFDGSYHDNAQDDIKGYDAYSDISHDKIGSINNILVDESGRIRYLVVDTGSWIFGKQVLLPIGRSYIDYRNERVYAKGMTKEQVENLPDYKDLEKVDYDYEEQVRGVYRTPMSTTPLESQIPVEASLPLEASAPLEGTTGYTEPRITESVAQPTPVVKPIANPAYNRDTYTYQQDADLYDTNERDHQTLRLYEERLVANKTRVKSGEVAVGKHIETETARVAVPVEKERVVIERTTPADAGRVVSPNQVDFREGEVARMDIYEETPDIQKQTVVREEVKIKKVVEQNTVEAQEKIRREELDIDTDSDRIQDRRV